MSNFTILRTCLIVLLPAQTLGQRPTGEQVSTTKWTKIDQYDRKMGKKWPNDPPPLKFKSRVLCGIYPFSELSTISKLNPDGPTLDANVARNA